ncbi:glycosyltransferase family 4 protein [Rhizobium sp. 18055]|uniref:glycosyltransferase family 4 protein n=1 Tax=Rhizobium sp. 18055 TaxID=2681403 RepID=UPI00135C7725|nr:glycosyltransferase family 4 protein [Rhizobium sp. 18055]
MSHPRPKLLFFVTVDWFFCSHFLERAIAARNAGYEVVVLTHTAEHGARIRAAGLRAIHLNIDRRSLNPLSELVTLLRVWRVFKMEKPRLIHQVALKPILIGSLAARLCGISGLVNAVVGGGFLFSSDTLVAKFLRPLLGLALKKLLNPPGSKIVFENPDDLRAFVREGYLRESDAVLVRGAGVEPSDYQQAAVTAREPLVLLPARLLWDKGIGEFVEAARQLRLAGVTARFVIAGGEDLGNRAAIDSRTLAAWREEGVVEFWGFRANMPAVLAQASIVCLPSYREGLPKALLEAMAAGLPCVTTNVPGCREAVEHGNNGLLVTPRDVKSLANALEILINDIALRTRMGQCGRERVDARFSSTRVIQETLALYKQMLK